jgi:drug/metabolite transporter (DMT)-like permease
MREQNSAIATRLPALPGERRALLLGLLGVTLFSVSVPATRVAARSLDPTLVGLARAVAAGGLALVGLRLSRAGWPPRAIVPGLLVVAFGGVVGFPLLTALALRHVPAVHGAVAVGLLPIATAGFGALRARERPSLAFWAIGVGGVVCVTLFASSQGGGTIGLADALLLLAVVVCGLSYAEGALLARDHGGLAVISWALLLTLPLSVPVTIWRAGATSLDAPPSAWLALAYLGAVSMYLGYVPWYRALALGGIARIGQVQLVQPALSVLWAVLFLGETVGVPAAAALGGVLACAVAGRRARAR